MKRIRRNRKGLRKTCYLKRTKKVGLLREEIGNWSWRTHRRVFDCVQKKNREEEKNALYRSNTAAGRHSAAMGKGKGAESLKR